MTAAGTVGKASGELLTFFRGRVGLYHVLGALRVGAGDEVALQGFTCLAVSLAIRRLGAQPMFVDADPSDLGMTVEDLWRKISPRTRAIVVQHTFGIPADIVALRTVADEFGAALIEDRAHVLGGTVRGRQLGTFGTAAFYSCELGKPVVAGMGGGLIVHGPDLRTRVAAATSAPLKPPLSQRLMLESQYTAYRRVLTGRT